MLFCLNAFSCALAMGVHAFSTDNASSCVWPIRVTLLFSDTLHFFNPVLTTSFSESGHRKRPICWWIWEQTGIYLWLKKQNRNSNNVVQTQFFSFVISTLNRNVKSITQRTQWNRKILIPPIFLETQSCISLMHQEEMHIPVPCGKRRLLISFFQQSKYEDVKQVHSQRNA